ncbi:CubicO group peptidase, beta-lactamase class C family [Palleronia salina]|uniref:CubicO group peptidase, beta-lactamase class C family n=2 Tax=Palleronia salina TaxID=313368 RepID=A0A1M6EPA5_9RHOB|nr:CubicO group peptidase, beta-lactamase class C family [Palleronia salina]
MSMSLSRRTVLGGLAALGAARPGWSAEARWSELSDRAAEFSQIRSMIVSRGGTPLVERVFAGPSLDTPVNVKSVSKTIVSALAGVALDRGELPALDATLGDVAPRLIPNGADPRVREITVENLLSMQAGLERTSGGNYGGWIASSNWVSDALSRDFVADPGGRMLYSTGSTHVLGAVLSEVSGLSLLEQARQRLGAPLNIQIPPWTRDPQGRYMGGNQMALSPRGMIRFGQLYARDGTWDGEQVIGADYVVQSHRPRTRSPWSGLGYGLGWFLGQEAGADFALARGYGGQVICVAPSLDLVVAITSDPNQPARSQGYFGELMTLLRDAMQIAASA